MKPNNGIKLSNSIIHLHGEDWLAKQRIAGEHLAAVMTMLQKLISERTTLSLLELDKFAEDEIRKRGGTPTFKGFHGFPAATCISLNNQLVHGIPSNERLKDGDVISIDFGITYDGAIADSAITAIFGTPKEQWHQELIDTTQECLYSAIRAIAIGKRLGVVGDAIYQTAKKAGFNVITKYGGHGITWNKPHADLFIPNKSEQDSGIRIQSGLTIAIEPLLVQASCPLDTRVGMDGWAVYTQDISAHAEHSLYVHSDHVEIMTWRQNESERIERNVFF